MGVTSLTAEEVNDNFFKFFTSPQHLFSSLLFIELDSSYLTTCSCVMRGARKRWVTTLCSQLWFIGCDLTAEQSGWVASSGQFLIPVYLGLFSWAVWIPQKRIFPFPVWLSALWVLGWEKQPRFSVSNSKLFALLSSQPHFITAPVSSTALRDPRSTDPATSCFTRCIEPQSSARIGRNEWGLHCLLNRLLNFPSIWRFIFIPLPKVSGATN